MMPTIERFMMRNRIGNTSEKSRKTLTVVSVRSWLASANRFSS